MLRLLPDKPKTAHAYALKSVDENTHTALTKYDGWGTLIEIDSAICCVSRIGKPLPVDRKILNATKLLNLHPGTTLWGEWMKRRPDYDGPECIIILSPVYIGGEFVGHQPFKDRLQWVMNLNVPQDDVSITESSQMPDNPLMSPAYAEKDFDSFFQKQRQIARSEGVVVYKNGGQYYGHPTDSIKSSDMRKYKYRHGGDGRTEIF